MSRGFIQRSYENFVERYFEALLHAVIAAIMGAVIIVVALYSLWLAATVWVGCIAFWFWWELRQHRWSFARMGPESWRELIAPIVVLLIAASRMM